MAKFLDKTGLDTFWAKIKSTFQTLGNLVTTSTGWSSTPSDTKYPSEKLVKTSLDAKVSSIKKNETSITPTNGVVDIGYMPTTKEVESGSVQDTIQALRVVPGGAMGSVNLTASTVDSMSIPAGWYNYIWIPHRSGQSSSDNRNYGTLILTPMTTTPDEYIVEGSALGGSSPVYKARRMEQMNNKVSSWSSTTNNTRYPSEKLVKDYVDGKSWFKNTSNSGMQNSNAYYQCISAPTADFSALVKLYDVTEFFDGTIVNQNERSVFFGDVSLIRDGGNAGCKYARVCAMIGYNNASSNIILQSDDDNAYPVLVKEDFERLDVSGTVGAYVISNNVATLDTTKTKARYFVVDCSEYSRVFINAGFYNASGVYGDTVKAYIFANDGGSVLGNSTGPNFDGYVDVPAGATKLYLHTNSGYSQVSVGPTTTSPKYFLAMRYVDGWPAGTIEYFGRFYTRVTASAAYSARPLLLTYVQCFQPVGTASIPTGYVIQKSASYTTHAKSANKLATARKIAVSLSNTSTDTSFDGSADVTNIKVSDTLPVANGGTGKTTAKAAEYNLTTGKSEISDATSGDDRVVFELASPSESNGVTRGFRKLSTIWTWIKGLLYSESGVNISGNAATATAAQSGSALETAINGKVDKVTGKGLSTNDYTTTEKNKLAGIAAGAEVNVQSDWNQATTTADDYIKNKPTIPSGTQLVYDCGTGSTSTTDFDNALAAFNAGKWVIINKGSKVYHCVGSYGGPGLRFKQLANEVSLLKVNTLTWTKGSAPTEGTQLEASLTGHTHSQYLTASDITGKMETNGSNATSAAGGNIIRAMSNWTNVNEDNEAVPAANITSGGTTQGRYTFAKIWNWIKGKMTSDSGVNISGNAATSSKVAWTVGTASTGRPVGFANSGNSSSYSQGSDFDGEIVYDKDFTYKPSGNGNSESALTVTNPKSSSGNEAAVIVKADVAGSAVWLDSTATGGSHKRGLWAPASSVSGDSAKWILFNDYVNQSNNSGGWEFIGTSESAKELRIPYGSGSVYLQIGVSGTYLALGTNMADGVMVNYAGQASQAAVAEMLGTTSVGSPSNPIYLNNGVPTECNWWVS